MSRRGDAAVSDITGTLLMVGAIVLAGGALTALVASNLSQPAPPPAALALATPAEGDASLRLLHRHGEPLLLDDLQLLLRRGEGDLDPVPRASWSASDPRLLRPGEALTLALPTPLAAEERVSLLVRHVPSNALLAEARASAPGAGASGLGFATLSASADPFSIPADATTATLLTVLVSHPAGGAAVASVRADLAAMGGAPLVLRDHGQDGDRTGGDGVWSGLLRAPIGTVPGVYAIPVVATDVGGGLAGATTVSVNVTSNLTAIVGGLGALANLTNGAVNLSNLSISLNGTCVGCVITGGVFSLEGTRITAPTSQNVTEFSLNNFTWDRMRPAALTSDAAIMRVTGATWSWSMYLRFGHVHGVPSITRLEVYNANATTVYLPAANSRVPLEGLTLNMLNPTQSGFLCSTGCAAPMTYDRADIRGNPAFLVSFLRDESNNFQSQDIGIISLDVRLR